MRDGNGWVDLANCGERQDQRQAPAPSYRRATPVTRPILVVVAARLRISPRPTRRLSAGRCRVARRALGLSPLPGAAPLCVRGRDRGLEWSRSGWRAGLCSVVLDRESRSWCRGAAAALYLPRPTRGPYPPHIPSKSKDITRWWDTTYSARLPSGGSMAPGGPHLVGGGLGRVVRVVVRAF